MESEKTKIERSGFVFYLSFYEAAEALDPDEQLQLYRAIIRYGLFGEVPTADEYKKHIIAMFKLILPQIDANNKRYLNGKMGGEHGKKGGRPKKENPTETPKKPQENPTETPKEKDKEKDKEKEKEKDKDNADGVSDSASVGIGGTVGCPIPPGMTKEEYERRIKEARE